MDLYEIKLHEKAKKGLLGHPARYRFVNCFKLDHQPRKDLLPDYTKLVEIYSPVGSRQRFYFINKKFADFDYFNEEIINAWVLGKISEDRELEADRIFVIND